MDLTVAIDASVRKQQLALRYTSGAIVTLWKVTGFIS